MKFWQVFDNFLLFLTLHYLSGNEFSFISQNEKELVNDFNYHNKGGIIKGDLSPFVSMMNQNDIFIDKRRRTPDIPPLAAVG